MFDVILTSSFILLCKFMSTYAEEPRDPMKTITLAHPYDEDFHVVFGMILTTLLIMATFLVISVVTIWTMDPGRESIIYRMTNQRVKKDN